MSKSPAGKRQKQARPRAVLPIGFHDNFGAEVILQQQMLQTIRDVFHKFGFDPLETPAIEYLDALGKFLPDLDSPNEGVFAWKEDDAWLALRYDLTAPLARVAAQYRNQLPVPYRRYSIGPVWRNEKPGPGRFRQFMQCDADTVGTASVGADAEICVLVDEILQAVGMDRKDYQIKINNRKVLDGVLMAAGIIDDHHNPASESIRGSVFRAMDKLDRLGLDGVISLLGEGRLDESGDYTKGANLTAQQIDIIRAFLTLDRNNTASLLDDLRHLVGDTDIGSEGVFELEQIMDILSSQLVPSETCIVDPAIVRGLGYYTGIVMEADLVSKSNITEPVTRLGSVAGGGRYDNLITRFTGHAVPATGVSIGIDRLMLTMKERCLDPQSSMGPVLVTVMDRHRISDYQVMVAQLRAANIRTEMYLGNARNFGRQLKYADQRNCPIAVIQGEDERSKGVVQIKDLVLGKELSADSTHEEWKQRAWQIEAGIDDWVDEIKQILDRQTKRFKH